LAISLDAFATLTIGIPNKFVRELRGSPKIFNIGQEEEQVERIRRMKGIQGNRLFGSAASWE
jgi:hypothetical protein